jgi:hypothetical protein
MKMNMKKMTCILVLILVAVLSVTKLSDWACDPANHEHSIAQTEDNIATVMKLSAGAAASSVAVTLLPGDVATPVANQLAELSKYFLLILSALYLEKYLITLTGYVTFTWLIPIICALLIGYIFSNRNFLLKISVKVALCAAAICLVIPMSVKISDVIYATQETGVESTIDEMDNYEVPEDEDTSIIDKITGIVTNAVDDAVDRATDMVTDLIESLAIMLTISCLIPILVFVLLIWMIKMIFTNASIHIDEDTIKRIRSHMDA